MGFMIHKRYTNFPIELVPLLHSNLQEDMNWVKSQSLPDPQSNSEITKEFSNLSHVLVLGTCHADGLTLGEKKSHPLSGTIVYDEFEDEVFVQHSSASVLYKYHQNLLFATIMPLKNYRSSIDELQSMCKKC